MRRRLVLRKKPECFHIEHEAFRRAFDPELRCPLVGYRVVAAVDLDDRKFLSVVLQPVFRRLGSRRIEAPALDKRFVCPRRRADENVVHA